MSICLSELWRIVYTLQYCFTVVMWNLFLQYKEFLQVAENTLYMIYPMLSMLLSTKAFEILGNIRKPLAVVLLFAILSVTLELVYVLRGRQCCFHTNHPWIWNIPRKTSFFCATSCYNNTICIIFKTAKVSSANVRTVVAVFTSSLFHFRYSLGKRRKIWGHVPWTCV